MVKMRSLISLNCCQTESYVSKPVGMGFMSDWSMTKINLGYYCTCVNVYTTSKWGVQSLWRGIQVMSLCHNEHLCMSMYHLWVMDDAVSYAVLMSYVVLGCSTKRLLKERAMYSPLWRIARNIVQSRLKNIMFEIEKHQDLPLNQVNRVAKHVQVSTTVYN